MSMTPKIAALAALVILGCSETADRSAQTTADTASREAADQRDIVLFVGTSLTAGYGIGAEHAYPALLQRMIDSAGLPFRAVNAGISGETSAGGLRRIDWALQQPLRVLVLELGANDALRGLDPDSMQANLEQIIERTREKYPEAEIVVAGMEAPPNLGNAYGARFRSAYKDVARKYDAVLIPFILAGVGGRPELNQEDGIHPTMQGQRIMADTVWKYLEPVLRAAAQR